MLQATQKANVSAFNDTAPEKGSSQPQPAQTARKATSNAGAPEQRAHDPYEPAVSQKAKTHNGLDPEIFGVKQGASRALKAPTYSKRPLSSLSSESKVQYPQHEANRPYNEGVTHDLAVHY